ncbi:aspartate aminotransferase family protein (plasmid) [Mesorhizobium sp. ORM8.1]
MPSGSRRRSEAAGRVGIDFFANNEPGIRLANEIVQAVPCAEKVRFTTSGSEAVLYALRIARAYTKKDKILKFEGGYHGMSDYSLMSLAPKQLVNFPRPRPDSPGIPRVLQDEVIVAPFNDLDTAASLIRENIDDLACVIVEPFQRLLPPRPGFLEGLREVTAELGIVLIFDEVVTGFRFAYGGAQEYYGVVPDLCTLGKIIGGGFALGALAGRTEIMAHFDKSAVGEEGFVTQIGTLSGSPVASAAGLASLEILKRPGAYDQVYENGRRLMGALSEIIESASFPAQVVGEPLLFDVVYTSGDVSDYRTYIKGDAALQKCINKLMRAEGILKPESKFYMSTAHTPDDIDRTIDAFKSALKQCS